MNIQTLPTSTTASRARALVIAALRALRPRWMDHDLGLMPAHRRMGAWEAHASAAAREVMQRMRERQREEEQG
ncbi:MAG TPA: hypothetical protein VEC06_04270 [Paucimonas sp.]|nr:hypothetical protein [Paucimonas sp.]